MAILLPSFRLSPAAAERNDQAAGDDCVDTTLPEQVLETCLAYQRAVALAALDLPPGESRETRADEALSQAHAALTPAHREALQSLVATVPASQHAPLQSLQGWLLRLQLHQALLPGQREMQARQRNMTCLVDEEPIPLLASFPAMAQETRRDRRATIEAALCAQLRDLTALNEAHFRTRVTTVDALGYATPDALWAAVLPVDPATCQDLATQILTQTEELYLDLLTWAARRRLRLTPGQLRRHDILALFTFAEYHTYYQPGTVVPTVQACLRDLGLDPLVDGRLTWRARGAHLGPPAALALQIPDEIVLSYGPVQGWQGTELWAQASGRALLWAHTSADLPEVQRALGDPALVDSQALLWAEVLADPPWLAHYCGVRVDQNYATWRCLDRLYRLRRALGRFVFTRYLYTNNSLAGAGEAYRDLMMEACHVDYPQEYALFDADWEYTALTALRSWSLTAALLETLRTQFAHDWFRNPDAGDWLRAYWGSALGERLEERRDVLLGMAWDAEVCTASLRLPTIA